MMITFYKAKKYFYCFKVSRFDRNEARVNHENSDRLVFPEAVDSSQYLVA